MDLILLRLFAHCYLVLMTLLFAAGVTLLARHPLSVAAWSVLAFTSVGFACGLKIWCDVCLKGNDR